MSLSDVAEKIFSLTTNVEALQRDVDRLNDMSLDHDRRIVKLENTEDLLLEKAKVAAMEQSMNSYHEVVNKIIEIDKRIGENDERINSAMITVQDGS